MKLQTLSRSFLAIALCSVAAAAQDAKAFLGRWDITVTPTTGNPYPQWLELTEHDGQIDAHLQPRGGSWYAVSDAHLQAGKLILSADRPGSATTTTTWELTSPVAGRFTGVEKRNGTDGPTLVGVTAPSLDRPAPKKWSEPKPLFDGKDLAGWEPIGNVSNSKWIARDGDLVNNNPEVPTGEKLIGAANLKTTAKFGDFKLHVEVNCPEGGNSGVYLRGRYELQIGTEGGKIPSHEMGAIYSYYPPPAGAPLGLGKWTAFDVALVGRHVTVLRDGQMYHRNVEIPGPTGGALDSNEAEPGPFYLQGDHHGVIAYRNLTISVPEN